MKSIRVGLAAFAVAVLAGCGPDQPSTHGVRGELAPVPHAAWLSRHLPAEAIAYARIPTTWDAFAEPKEDVLHAVQVESAHAGLLEAIRDGVRMNVLTLLPPEMRPPLEMLHYWLRAPLEVAALKPPDGSPAPNALISAQVGFADAEAFTGWLDGITALSPQIRVLTPMDADGYLTVMAGPVPVFGHFNAADRHLLLLTGMSASQGELTRYAGQPVTESVLSEFEQKIDASGRNLALWLNARELYAMYTPMIPPAEAAKLTATGLDQARFLWLGAVSKGGRSSLKVHLAMPETGFRKLAARPHQPPGLSAAGEVDFALRLILPSAGEFAAAVDYVLSLGPDAAEARSKLENAKSEMDQAIGFDSRLLLDAFGPEIVVVSDTAGLWAGYQVRSREALDALFDAIKEKSGTEISRHRSGGIEIKHWALPALWSLPDAMKGEGEIPGRVAEFLGRLKSRLYWIEEDGYLIMASVPQVLAARARIGANRSLAAWLAGELQLDWRHSVLAVASEVRNSPRDVYHGYLGLLYFLADLVGAEFDPFALPNWIDAGLPEAGRIGFRLDSSPDALGISLDYEYSPVEVLFGGDALVGLAVVGIAAAIAVPAYHDYRTRAEVARALLEAAALKLAVAETYYATGAFPDAGAAAELARWGERTTMEVQPDTGLISIYFTDAVAAALSGQSLHLEPVADEGGDLIWVCSSDEIEPRHLPGSCQQ